MENYFRVNFKAQLIKLVLGFKADCQIDVFWKKGQKIAQSCKVPFANTVAIFNQQLCISCNMIYDTQNKIFRQKITKFQILLYTDKGNKKVGQIKFDVSKYLNQRIKTSKQYELNLDKCPDKNAKLYFKLTAHIQEKISADAISHSSQRTVNIQNLVDGSKSSMSSIINVTTNQIQKPTKEVSSPKKQQKDKKFTTATSIEVGTIRNDNMELNNNALKDYELQNKRMRQKLRQKQKLLKQNEQLKKKIKNEQYESVRQIRQKIQLYRKDIQKFQSIIKKQILLQKQVKNIEDQIFKCKYQIMNAFNYANQKGGGKLLFQMQQACGLKEI